MNDGSGSTGRFTTDVALVVRSWDAWLTEVTGLAEADASGRPLAGLFPELVERGLLPRLQRVADTGVVEVLAPAFHRYLVPCAPRAASPNFTRMQQHVTIEPMRSEGAIVGVAVTIEDVTARLDMERELAAQLQSPDDAVRLQAARQLAAPGLTDAAVVPLSGVLGDPSWRVRRAAAEGMARGEDDSFVEALLAALRERHRDPAALNSALTALERARRDVVPDLIALLDTPDAEVRTYAALALGHLRDRRAVPVLLDALDDPDANVRFHAIEALGRIRARQAAHRVAEVAESRDFSVAFAALDALALIGEPSVASRIVPLLDDPLLQTAAAEALGRLGSEDVAAPLAALLDRPEAAVPEVAAALALLHARFEEHYGEGRLIADLAGNVLTPAAVRALIEAIPNAGDEHLEGIAVVLGWSRGDGVEEALATLMERPAVCRIAADILARRGARAVAPLVRLVGSGDDETRKAAAAALGRVGSAAAVPALVSLLDADAEVAVVAAGALGGIGDPGAFEPLFAHLDHPQPAVRQALVAALSSLGHPDMPPRVVGLLDAQSPRLRECGAKIAGYFGYPECVDAMLALCEDEDPAVRRVVVEQLAHLDDPRALAAMTTALRTGPAGVRAAAARGLAHLDAGSALAPLLAALGDSDPWVRYYAARSAGHHRLAGTAAALAALASTDSVPPARIAAIEALGAMGAASAADTLRRLVDDADPAIGQAALTALAEMPGGEVAPVLLDALRSSDDERRLPAIAALGRRRDSNAVGALAGLARAAGGEAVRERAVAALAQIGDERAVAALIELAEDPRQGARVVAALAGLPESRVADVATGLHHPDVEIRCAAVEALARMRFGPASRRIVEALQDEEPSVRFAAAQALGRLDVREADATLATVARTDGDAAVRRAAQGALGEGR